jgi:MFS family permease
MADSKDKKYFSGLTKNSFLLAFASFFADISTEMLYPVLPIYLTQNLKVGGSIVGLVEGFAGATQNIIQGASGWLSDKIQKRKPIAFIGYMLAAIAKPLMGLSTVWQGILGARALDRLGTGTRSAPRDALIAGSVSEKDRGKAFGLEGMGDNLGAFVGPIAAVFLLFAFKIDIRHIFYLAAVPGLLAVAAILMVREGKASVAAKAKLDINVRSFPRRYWNYLLVTTIFGLGNSSNSFLILQTRAVGVTLEITIIIYALFNFVAALISYPSGYLSDKFGRRNVLLSSFLIFIITYLGFAATRNILIIAGLFILYGLYQGISRSVGKAFATDFVPQSVRASAVGWYNTTVGLSGLVASVVAGQLWDKLGHPAVFIFGAIFATFGSTILLFSFPRKNIL